MLYGEYGVRKAVDSRPTKPWQREVYQMVEVLDLADDIVVQTQCRELIEIVQVRDLDDILETEAQ